MKNFCIGYKIKRFKHLNILKVFVEIVKGNIHLNDQKKDTYLFVMVVMYFEYEIF